MLTKEMEELLISIKKTSRANIEEIINFAMSDIDKCNGVCKMCLISKTCTYYDPDHCDFN